MLYRFICCSSLFPRLPLTVLMIYQTDLPPLMKLASNRNLLEEKLLLLFPLTVVCLWGENYSKFTFFLNEWNSPFFYAGKLNDIFSSFCESSIQNDFHRLGIVGVITVFSWCSGSKKSDCCRDIWGNQLQIIFIRWKGIDAFSCIDSKLSLFLVNIFPSGICLLLMSVCSSFKFWFTLNHDHLFFLLFFLLFLSSRWLDGASVDHRQLWGGRRNVHQWRQDGRSNSIGHCRWPRTSHSHAEEILPAEQVYFGSGKVVTFQCFLVDCRYTYKCLGARMCI